MPRKYVIGLLALVAATGVLIWAFRGLAILLVLLALLFATVIGYRVRTIHVERKEAVSMKEGRERKNWPKRRKVAAAVAAIGVITIIVGAVLITQVMDDDYMGDWNDQMTLVLISFIIACGGLLFLLSMIWVVPSSVIKYLLGAGKTVVKRLQVHNRKD